MTTLAGQRAQFTWALRQYNLAEDAELQAFYARRLAKYIYSAPANGFTSEEITQGQPYPAAEVAQYSSDPGPDIGPEINEEEAFRKVQEAVDVSDVLRLGEGLRIVYAYGYRCAADRLKIGSTEGDTVARIAAQVGTSTPDRPLLLLEIRTHDCSSLARAIHAILEYRGFKIVGAGKEWFKVSREEIVAIYNAIAGPAGSELVLKEEAGLAMRR